MHFFQADVHSDFPQWLLQKPVEQFEDALLLFQSAEQLAHLFLGEMQVEPHQIAHAVHMDFGTSADIEQTFGIQDREPLKNGVVGCAGVLQAL